MLSWSRSRRPSHAAGRNRTVAGCSSARSRNAAVWRASISACRRRGEALAGELADRVELAERVSPSTSSLFTRLWSARDIRPSRMSTPTSSAGPQTRSAVARSQPPTNTASRAKPPLALAQQVVAPGDRSAKGLLPLRDVARPTPQVELMLEALEDRIRLEELDPCSGQLDRERHAVEPGTDAGDGRGVVVRDGEVRADRDRPGDEQLDRLVLGDALRRDQPLARRQVELLELRQREDVERDRQAGDGVLLLTGDPERRSAGGDYRDVRAGPSRSPTTARRRSPARSCRARTGSAAGPLRNHLER